MKKLEISERTVFLALAAIEGEIMYMEEHYGSESEIPKKFHYKAKCRAHHELVKALEKGDLLMLPTSKWIRD